MIKFQSDKPNLTLDPVFYFPWIKHVIKEENHQPGDLFYHFCSDEYLLKLNRDFLQHDYLTDIITFPFSTQPEIVSGEIFISIDRVRENAFALQTGFEREFARVLIHGVLHLLGYGDQTDEEKRVMRSKEDYYLSLLPQK